MYPLFYIVTLAFCNTNAKKSDHASLLHCTVVGVNNPITNKLSNKKARTEVKHQTIGNYL